METHDFTAAKVGDKVSHPIYGNGVIDIIDETIWPINVKFMNNTIGSFTTNGKEHEEDTTPSLYHGHNTFQIIATPVSPYKEGEWIAVSIDDKEWYIEMFVGMTGHYVITQDFNCDRYRYQFHKSLTELNEELNNK